MSSKAAVRFSRRNRGMAPINEEKDEKSMSQQAIYHSNTLDCKILRYPHGEIYRGQTKNGNRHGKGQMIHKNGVVYEGLWENNKPYHVQISIYDDRFTENMNHIVNDILLRYDNKYK